MISTSEVESERLWLRPLDMNDYDPLLRLQQDPEMMRYMSDGHVLDDNETLTWLGWHIDLWNEDGFSLWAVELKPGRRFLGWLGMTMPRWFPELMSTPEIGWFIDREYWGQGLATEGAWAAVQYAFQRLDIDRLIGIYNVENRASGRVMEKIGMILWKEVSHPRFGFPIRVYEITRPL